MAEKRMFHQKIVESDAFLDMPLSTQALYFHLNMQADDDGFVNNPRRIQRTIGAADDDLKLLILKRFVLCFDGGIIVIKHWRMHNTLRKDRYTPTQYREELAMLEIKSNKSYTERRLPTAAITPGNQMATSWQPNGNHSATQCSVDKNRLAKIRLEEGTPSPPTLQEITAFIAEKRLTVGAEHFFYYYSERGWKSTQGNPIDWREKLLKWSESNAMQIKKADPNNGMYHAAYDPAEMEQLLDGDWYDE